MTTAAETAKDPRYPVGKAEYSKRLSREERARLIAQIEECPARMRDAVRGLNPAQLATPYREGGWTVHQVVNHVPDSHLNAYIRVKLALTEENPAIKTYEEQLWAETEDGRNTPPEISLTLLESLHQRWVLLLRSLPEAEFQKTLRHPQWGEINLNELLGLYAWHSRHHVAHITELRKRKGW